MSPNPFSQPQRRRLVLKRGRERAIANRHPWVFSGAIERESGPEGAAIADLVDRDFRRIASGFYSAKSQIRVRVVAWHDEDLSEDFLKRRISDAVERREGLIDEATNAARFVNSEGDDLSGLVVDRYADALVIEISSAGLDGIRDLVVEHLGNLLRPRTTVVHNDLPARRIEGVSIENVVIGENRDEVQILENGLRFFVSLKSGQKTGFFLDQRDNRAIARSLAGGRIALNVFSYTGGFGVAAAAGGATSVREVEASDRALSIARRNHELNGSLGRADLVSGDAFEVLRDLVSQGDHYGIVVCDPPAFVKSRKDVEKAARGYKDINLQALKLVEPGGCLMTFSCSGHMPLDLFQKIVFAAALDARRRVSILRRLGAGIDHPVSLYCPEGEYLKGFLLRVE